MSAGTLTLTNNSAAVTGSGTAFTTELAVGDFIVVTVGGIPYTLAIKTVNSNTSLTLVSNYTGPTQAGAAWYAVPRVAMNLVTAALVAQSAEALRGLNYDKQNWQRIFSGTGNVTVTLPDGSSFTGPAWSGITSLLAGKLDKSQNLNDVADKAASRTNLGLDKTVNTEGNQSISGEKKVGAFGLGGDTLTVSDTSLLATFQTLTARGSSFARTDTPLYVIPSYSPAVFIKTRDTYALLCINYRNGTLSTVTTTQSDMANQLFQTNTIYGTSNTTKASDGTLKAASPVVKLFADGSFETNDESEGCSVTRLKAGEYLIEGCMGMNSDAAWGGIDGGFDIPKDRNGQALIWLDYEVNADGSVLVKTFHREYPSAPIFARNSREGFVDGEPADIPADQFVSVRVEMPQNSIWNQRAAMAQVPDSSAD
ncbi:phage tail fiber protein [Enterobacter hormaechei]|uniref:phage tail fiber protein n=1 Tax=Enterobacter hormaechei TaxID=158836 RepID=UPI0012B83B30|nr:phage tail protein [Enterobacter hormaechei]